jgi:hypothetical protein
MPLSAASTSTSSNEGFPVSIRPPSQMKLVTVARISYAKLQQVRYFELRVPALPRCLELLLN